MNSLSGVINLNLDICSNCFNCLKTCPVKSCNEIINDIIKINSDLCIGCGECIKSCLQKARTIKDDFENFIEDIKFDKNIVVIVTPSILNNFPDHYLNINGWFNELGIRNIFDVSYGGMLSINNYSEYIKNKDKEIIISQPCPVVVNFIEIYKPELKKHIAKIDSPIIETIKKIKENYPDLKNYKFAIISPCIAKKREFNDNKIGDYNITFSSLKNYLIKNEINLDIFNKTNYNNAINSNIYSIPNPGGLMSEIIKSIPELNNNAIKVDGIYKIISFLNKFDFSKKELFFIDCLSCKNGCNYGTGV